MALFTRRTGIVGIITASLLCLVCGIPFIVALLGTSGVSLGVVLSDLPVETKSAAAVTGFVVLTLLIIIFKKRHAKPTAELNQ